MKDIPDAIAHAQHILQQSGRHTILFVDEVHRFNKAQQDAFLPFVEQGLVTFIGATTENPSFEVNSALLSRAQVYVLHALAEEDLRQLFNRTQQDVLADLELDDAVCDRIIGYADGDARRLLNVMEQLHTAARTARIKCVDTGFLDNTLAQNLRCFDKGGEAFYDQISALHKSVRAPTRMPLCTGWCVLDGGRIRYLSRRIVRMAWEEPGDQASSWRWMLPGLMNAGFTE